LSIIKSKIRGIENESPFQSSPPSRSLGEVAKIVELAIESLKKYYIPHVRWRIENEVGNLGHEIKILHKNAVALNRFRIYDDLAHFERSSCSWRNPYDAVIYGSVGEILDYIGSEGASRLTNRKVATFRNNTAPSITNPNKYISYGTHYNILLSRKVCDGSSKKWNEFLEKLLPYFVTRILLIGIGGFIPTSSLPSRLREKYKLPEYGFKFVISPRSHFLMTDISQDTMKFRGIVNKRDEPHANPNKYWRYHDINDEAQRCIFQQYVTDVMQTLVFSAFERGYIKKVPKIKDWEEITRLSMDTPQVREGDLDFSSPEWKIEVIDDGNIRSVDAVEDILIGVYLNSIEEMLNKESDVDSNDKHAYEILETTLRELARRNLESLYYGLDWITKQIIIFDSLQNNTTRCEKCKLTNCKHVALSAQNQYELVDGKVLYYIGLNKDSNDNDIFDPNYHPSLFDCRESLEFAKDNIDEDWSTFYKRVRDGLLRAPRDTRDYFVSSLLNNRNINSRIKSVSWGEVVVGNSLIVLDEPFMLSEKEIGNISEAESIEDIERKVKYLYPNKIIKL
jgi:hypothetical protein